jgi:hypothetical protein
MAGLRWLEPMGIRKLPIGSLFSYQQKRYEFCRRQYELEPISKLMF